MTFDPEDYRRHIKSGIRELFLEGYKEDYYERTYLYAGLLAYRDAVSYHRYDSRSLRILVKAIDALKNDLIKRRK